MTICALIVCSLIAGSGDCQRGRGAYEIVDLPHVTTATGCRQVEADIRSGAIPLPANLKLIERRMLPPREPQTQEAKR